MSDKPRGGKRPGAGRHSIYKGERLQQKTVRLPSAHLSTLYQVNPELSGAIRDLLDDPRIARAVRLFIQERKRKP